MPAAVNCLHILFLILSTAHDECFGKLRSMTLLQNIDMWFIVVAIVRRGGAVIVMALLLGLLMSETTLITVII